MRPETLTEAVYDRLRADLLCGSFAPGVALRMEELRQRYGISTSPLREAMFRLSAEGLLVLSSQRGFRAAPLSRQDLFDLADRRIEIETHALAMSFRKGNDDWESEVVKRHHRFCLISRQVSKANMPLGRDWDDRHRALHRSLIEACDSPWLLRFWSLLYDHFDRYRHVAGLTPPDLVALTRDEELLVAAALRRDADAAVTILTQHILRTRDGVCSTLFSNASDAAA